MKSFACVCGNRIYFENTQCVSCSSELGWCPACRNLTAILPQEPTGAFRCGNDSCGASLVKCHNYAVERVCNRCCLTPDAPAESELFCDYCRFNDTIPDLTDESNREKWARLEAAKRRLLYSLDALQLPYGNEQDGVHPPLSFDFKADLNRPQKWWAIGDKERVYTGHANGKITINIREADAVEREKARVSFQEAHRTIIGHFRHEIGHYYWQMLVQGRCEAECKAAFGNHENPTYTQAQQQYYELGPPNNWQANFISAYAAMHPWEDFAETLAAYLDMVSVLDTAWHTGIGKGCIGKEGLGAGLDPNSADLQAMVDSYLQLGLVVNEMNRSMGLKDLVPEIFAPPIVAKLAFVHDLLRRYQRTTTPTGS